MDKRQFLKTAAIISGGAMIPQSILSTPLTNEVDQFSLPTLAYNFDALEPFIDKLTMEIHYTKHHQAYISNLNKSVEGTKAAGLSIEEICKNISKFSSSIKNNAGGHYNHTFFWPLLKRNEAGRPVGKLAGAIDKKYGTFETFKEEFSKVAMARFGSGWAWLIVKDGELMLTSTANQDNPLMDTTEVKGKPVLALDVWEHAYYLRYQNKRMDYVASFWNIINWQEAGKNYEAAISK